jgi:hypothetical protein
MPPFDLVRDRIAAHFGDNTRTHESSRFRRALVTPPEDNALPAAIPIDPRTATTIANTTTFPNTRSNDPTTKRL